MQFTEQTGALLQLGIIFSKKTTTSNYHVDQLKLSSILW